MAPVDIESIVVSGLCAGCGVCSSMAPNSITMVLTDEGRMRPKIKDCIDDERLEKIMKVCPGKIVEGPSKRNLDGSRVGIMHPVLGPLRSWHRGWAADKHVRWKAAAGGSLTALGSFLLETGRVQKVLHVRASSQDPTTTDVLVSSTPEEVLSGCQSRYGPAAPLQIVMQLLDQGIVFAVIAKPCDCSAIRQLAKIDDRVKKQIPYLLSIFCGGLPSRNAVLKIAEHHGVKNDDISTCRFRGHGWPGLFSIVRKSDGMEFGTTYNETWKWPASPLGPDAGIAKYDIQWRCKICPDAIGELADVTCPDGWLYDAKLGKHTSVDGEDPGQNLVLARTPVGEQLVKDIVAAERLILAPIDMKEIETMHADHYPRKTSWPIRMIASWWCNCDVRLSVVNYRPLSSIWAAGVKNLYQVWIGTVLRLRAQMHIEPKA